jgi:hypothetical protein
MDRLFRPPALGTLRREGERSLWLASRAAAAPTVALRASSGAAAPYRPAGTINNTPGKCYPCPRSRVLPMSPAVQGQIAPTGKAVMEARPLPRHAACSTLFL